MHARRLQALQLGQLGKGGGQGALDSEIRYSPAPQQSGVRQYSTIVDCAIYVPCRAADTAC
jgi:hypothetical protein